MCGINPYTGAHVQNKPITHTHNKTKNVSRVRYRTYRTYRTSLMYQALTRLSYRTPIPHIPHKKMNDGKDSKRVIRCTPENAKAMAGVVKNWPELHALVQTLQAQDLFPGLRAMQITITGSAEAVAKGLDAVNEINAAKAV